MPLVARINVTPVKGTALQQLERAWLSEVGIEGNRRYYLIDARGRLFSGSVHGPIVQVAAEHDRPGGTLTCRFPDGTVATFAAAAQTYFDRTCPVPYMKFGGPFDDAFE